MEKKYHELKAEFVCLRVCLCVCVRVCVRACVRVCVCMCERLTALMSLQFIFKAYKKCKSPIKKGF